MKKTLSNLCLWMRMLKMKNRPGFLSLDHRQVGRKENVFQFFFTTFHVLTSFFIFKAAEEAQLHVSGMACVWFGLAVAFYECVVWSFDIPGISCHGKVAAQSQSTSSLGALTACLGAATNCAPLALACMLIVSRKLIGTIIFFVLVTYYVFVQIQYWWAPYFFDTAPHDRVIRYLQVAEGLVAQLPSFKGHALRPDIEHTILLLLSLCLLLSSWYNFAVVLFVGYDESSIPSPFAPGRNPRTPHWF